MGAPHPIAFVDTVAAPLSLGLASCSLLLAYPPGVGRGRHRAPGTCLAPHLGAECVCPASGLRIFLPAWMEVGIGVTVEPLLGWEVLDETL